jgi:hypothetical protein
MSRTKSHTSQRQSEPLSITPVSTAITWAEIECSSGEYVPPQEGTQHKIEHTPKLGRRRVDELHPHPSYVRHGLSPSAAQFAALEEMGDLVFSDPIIITQDGVIIDGNARVALARRQGLETLVCLEHELSDEQALRLLIHRHRGSDGLNAFDLALLALELEPSLREAARANQQWGGENKGSSNLSEAQKVEVRSKTAAVAGISPGTLDKVRKLVHFADLKIQHAARAEEISIHRASQWCSLPLQGQIEALEEHRSRKGVSLTSRRLIQKHVARMVPTHLIPPTLGDVLRPLIPNTSSALDSIAVSEIDVPGNIAYFSQSALRSLRVIKEGQNGKTRLDEEVCEVNKETMGSTVDSHCRPRRLCQGA